MSDEEKQLNQASVEVAAGAKTQGGDDRSGRMNALLSSAGNLAAPIMASLIVSVCVSAMALAVYDKTRKGDFAVIDLAGIVELEQLRLTASVIKIGTTDEERLKAFQRVQSFGGVLEKAIDEIKADCKCVLLARNAFIGGGGKDYTDSLKAKVGLSGVDLESVRKLTEMAMSRAVPSPESMRAASGQTGNGAFGGGTP